MWQKNVLAPTEWPTQKMRLEETKFITWLPPSKRESGSREHKEPSKIISLDFKQHMGKISPKPLCFVGSDFLLTKDFLF